LFFIQLLVCFHLLQRSYEIKSKSGIEIRSVEWIQGWIVGPVESYSIDGFESFSPVNENHWNDNQENSEDNRQDDELIFFTNQKLRQSNAHLERCLSIWVTELEAILSL